MSLKKCLFCKKPAKVINNKNGSVKIVRKTCGNSCCVTKIMSLNGTKGNRVKKKQKSCQHCSKIFDPASVRQLWCKKCVPSSEQRRRMQKYKLSQQDFDSMYNKQRGKCKLCPKPIQVVDHCHNTGEVRGLLCTGCNVVIGLLDRDTLFLTRALVYTGKNNAFQIKETDALDVCERPRDGEEVGCSHQRHEEPSRRKRRR